jgi:hypothetical protein
MTIIQINAKKSYLEDCLNDSVIQGHTEEKYIKIEAERLFKLKYDGIDFLTKNEVYKNYFS